MTPHKKNAPAGATAEATPTEGAKKMLNTIISREHTFGDIRQTLDKLDKLDSNQYLMLDPEHPVYKEPGDVWIRPATDFSDPDAIRAELGSDFALSRFLELWHVETGKHTWLSELPPGYVDERLADLPLVQRENYFQPNAVTRIGDHLMVGLGQWYCVAERVLDGEAAFEFVSAAEKLRRDNAEKAKFLPTAEEHKPSWAEKVTVEEVDAQDSLVFVAFESAEFVSADCGGKASAVLSQRVAFDMDGALVEQSRLIPLLNAPEVFLADDVVTPQSLRHFANGLYRLAVALEDELDTEAEAV